MDGRSFEMQDTKEDTQNTWKTGAFERHRDTVVRFRQETRVNEFLTKFTANDLQEIQELSTFNHYAKKLAPFLMETVGTCLFLFAIGCIVVTGDASIVTMAIGSSLMCLVFMGGHISGAHYNPAVTLGLFLSFRGMITLERAGLYILLQCFGATIGSLIARGITGVSFNTQVGAAYSVGAGLAAEFVATFFFVTVVLNVATTRSQDNNSFFGLAIGFTIFSLATAIGHISGGAINPAVGMGTFLAKGLVTGEWYSGVWIYWVGPFLGAAFAALFFRLTNFQEYTSTTGYTISNLFNLKIKGKEHSEKV